MLTVKHNGLLEEKKGEERGRKPISFLPFAENLVDARILLSVFVLTSHGSWLSMSDWSQTKLRVAT